MSLERELVFQLREKGASEADVLEIVENMGDPRIPRTKPVNLNSKLIKVALSQYRAQEYMKERGDYVKKDREKLRELIEKEEREIENNTENLISVKIKKTYTTRCDNCLDDSHPKYYAAVIKTLNRNGGIPVPVVEERNLFIHCGNCGYIKKLENKPTTN